MIMHSPNADTEDLGDLFVNVAFAYITENFVLAICELENTKACFSGGRVLEETLEIVGHLTNSLVRREGVWAECPLDRFEQRRGHAAAQKIPRLNTTDGHKDLIAFLVNPIGKDR